MEEEKSIDELREEFENTAVEDDKISEASLSKEERILLENSIQILGPREQEEADQDIYNGVLLWFQNKSLEAEKVFMQKPNDPLAVNCLGATLFLKAMMTFAEPDIAYASSVLGRTKMLTTVYANVYKNKAPPSSSSSSSGGLFSKLFSFVQQQHEVTNGEMRAAVTRAECGLLTGLMQLLQESMVGYVKAGWSLRRGYKDVTWCYQQLQHSTSSAAPSPFGSPITSPIVSPFVSPHSSPPSSPRRNQSDNNYNNNNANNNNSSGHQSRNLAPAPHHAFDKHTLGGIQFAYGCINVVMASLPPRVLKMVSFFGFSCDRELGFDLLRKSLQGGGIRAPLASLFLLSFYIHLPSFVPILLPKYLPLAKEVLSLSLQMFPGSALHLWLAGRTHRLSRTLSESNDAFLQSIAVLDSNASDIPQLKDLCYYDLGLNYLWSLEWEKAASYFEKLAQHNYWSKAFYIFSQAICVYMMGQKEQAIILFELVPSLVVRKYGGRTLGVEQYVLRKVKMYSDLGYDLGSLPALEVIYIWNGFYCMPLSLVEKCLILVNNDLQKLEKRVEKVNNSEEESDGESDAEEEPYHDDIRGLLLLIKAAILQNLGGDKHFEEAFNDLQIVINECDVEEDTFVHPFAYYELGMLNFLNHKLEEAKEAFRKAREFSKYNFEFRLGFRLHMALSELSREKESGGKENEKDREAENEKDEKGEESVEVEEDEGAGEKRKKGKKGKKKKEKKKKEKKNKGK